MHQCFHSSSCCEKQENIVNDVKSSNIIGRQVLVTEEGGTGEMVASQIAQQIEFTLVGSANNY